MNSNIQGKLSFLPPPKEQSPRYGESSWAYSEMFLWEQWACSQVSPLVTLLSKPFLLVVMVYFDPKKRHKKNTKKLLFLAILSKKLYFKVFLDLFRNNTL